jgi:hypothetical protein
MRSSRRPKQARAAGVDAPNLCESVYARVRPSDELADLRERGRVGMTSPGLVADYVDDGERRWPIVVRELSHTWSPRMRDRQPSPESLLSATLSDGGTMETEEVIEAAAEAAAEAPDLAASVTMLAEQVATLTARVEALEGGATAGDTAAAAEPAPEQAAVMSDSVVRRIVADESAIKADVDAARRARVIPESHVATLTDLRRRDPKAFKAAVGLAPMRQPQQRVTLADEQTATLSDYDRARVTAKEKKITAG